MANIYSSKIKSGYKIILNSKPMLVISNEFVKPGKGQAFNRLKLKSFITNRLIEKTFKSNEYIELANLKEISCNFSYSLNVPVSSGKPPLALGIPHGCFG